MEGLIKQYSPFFFPVAFVLMWLMVTTILGFLSGWYVLMQRYPNRKDEALLKLGYQSGQMGLWVGMRGVLNVSVCHSGLRIGILRVFGVFCRDFFVPWEEISVRRRDRFLWRAAELQFGHPAVGKLSISAHIADRLARSASGHWPEAGPFLQEANGQVFVGMVKQWAVTTFFAALFFTVVPRLASPRGTVPPVSVSILFPAIVFGIGGGDQIYSSHSEVILQLTFC